MSRLMYTTGTSFYRRREERSERYATADGIRRENLVDESLGKTNNGDTTLNWQLELVVGTVMVI